MKQVVKNLSYNRPHDNAEQYLLSYLKGQALKEKIKEKSEDLNWER